MILLLLLIFNAYILMSCPLFLHVLIYQGIIFRQQSTFALSQHFLSPVLFIFLCSTYYWHRLKTYLHSSAYTIRVWPGIMKVLFPTLSPVPLTHTPSTKQRLGFHRPKTMMYYEMWGRFSYCLLQKYQKKRNKRV